MLLFALPFFAAANSAAVQSVLEPVTTQVAEILSAGDTFSAADSSAVLETGISSFDSLDIHPEARTFSAGAQHSLAISADGTLWAWGLNTNGQTGLGTTTGNQTTPAQVGTATNWIQVSAGHIHSNAIRSDGTLWAWGAGGNGQTGLGTTTGTQTTPAQVGTATNWTQVSAEQSHSLAIRSDGTLWSWGFNANGRTGLGISSLTNTLVPTQVGIDTTWSQVSAGESYSLALRSDGTLWAWGSNENGQTGLGITAGDQTTPAQVGTVTNWTQVSAGANHSHAIRSDGTLWAWGTNADGRTGLGTTTGNQTTPLQVGTASDWLLADVSTMGIHSLAMKTDDSLWTWGTNNHAQLGKGITTTSGQGAGTNNWIPWRIAASPVPQSAINWLPSAVAAGSATTPYSGRQNVTPDCTPHIIIRFDRQMCTEPTSLGTIEVSNGATVDVANGSWSSSVIGGVTVPNSVFSADLDLRATDTLHTVVASGFRDASLGDVMYPHGTGPGGAYPNTVWTFTTGEVPIPVVVMDVEPKGHEIPASAQHLYIVFDQLISQTNPERQITLSWTEAGVEQTHILDLSTAQWCTDNSILTVALPVLRPATTYTVLIEGFMSTSGVFMTGPFTHTFTTETVELDLAITKNLLMPVGTTIPQVDFVFNIEAYSYNGDSSAAEMADMPALSVTPLTFSTADTGTADGDTLTLTQISEFLLRNEMPFPFAGLFVYRISEADNTFTNTDTETMLFDPTVYQITFQVENMPAPAPTNSLFVSAIFLQRVVDGVPGDKIDISDNLTDALTFTNIFVRNHDNDDPLDPNVAGGLRISKAVEGVLANQTRFFDFDLGIWVPSVLTSPTGYRAYVVDSLNNTVVTTTDNGTIAGSSDNGAYLFFSSGATQTVSLRHGQTLVFVGTHVGARYSVTEQAVTDFMPSVVLVSNGQPVSITNPDMPNTTLTVPMQILGEAANRADFTNITIFVPPSGFDTGAFGMALLLAAIVALAVIVTAAKYGKRTAQLPLMH